MATLVLQAFQMFCWIPGGSIGAAFILPLINPALLISCFIPIMLSVMFIGGPNFLNSKDSTKTDWNRGSASAFIIYYSIFFIITVFVMNTACKVVDYIPI